MKLTVDSNGFSFRMRREEQSSIKRWDHPILKAFAHDFESKVKRGGQDHIEKPLPNAVQASLKKTKDCAQGR